jgi:hypothetical protein
MAHCFGIKKSIPSLLALFVNKKTTNLGSEATEQLNKEESKATNFCCCLLELLSFYFMNSKSKGAKRPIKKESNN